MKVARSIDVAGTQTAISVQFVAGDADFVLALKDSQTGLEDVSQALLVIPYSISLNLLYNLVLSVRQPILS